MLRNIGAPELIIVAVLLILILGWKRLPDAARSLGRSMRVFKSEVSEMRHDETASTRGRESDETRGPGGANATEGIDHDRDDAVRVSRL